MASWPMKHGDVPDFNKPQSHNNSGSLVLRFYGSYFSFQSKLN